MRHFIHYTGLLSAAAGVTIQFSALRAFLMPALEPGMLLRLFGCIAVFLGITLILAARDLKNRAPLVAWEGILRLVGGSILVYDGITTNLGLHGTLAGAGDIAIGLTYLMALSRHQNTTLSKLLHDQHRRVESHNSD
jgi:uncharacterized membrane protein HdeD (DUF308 family)